jgi:hypothetical protein
MQATAHATAPSDTRAAASLRLTVRLELAEMLGRIIPPYISILGEEGDPDLLPTEAREAAIDLLGELEARGYTIVRRAAR